MVTKVCLCPSGDQRGEGCGNEAKGKLSPTWGADPSFVGPDSVPQG